MEKPTHKRGTGKQIYVNKEHDVFYFGRDYNEYWFLCLMEDSLYDDEERDEKELAEWVNILSSALAKFLKQLRGTRNLAIHWELWYDLLKTNGCIDWLRNLPWLTDLTLVVKVWDLAVCENIDKGTTAKFADLVHGSMPADCVRMTREWSQALLSKFQLEYPEKKLPRLHVDAIYRDDPDENEWQTDKDVFKDIEMVHNCWKKHHDDQ